MRFWIRPSRDGSPLLRTVEKCNNYPDAVQRAASQIYLHISTDAVGAFPVWARWTTQDALDDYLEASRDLREEYFQDAVAGFESASTQEQYNAMADLQLANLYERAADPDDAAPDRAMRQAQALRRYLAVADEWPELVEARYRTSVVASALATTLEEIQPKDRPTARHVLKYLAAVPIDATDATVAGAVEPQVAQLRDLAAHESKAVLQLLKPWYALLRELRLRTQFEPKAHSRRRLRHTVSISKHAVRMRRISGDDEWYRRAEVRYRSAAVHLFHVRLGWGTIDWQARYNASCFDMLLLNHLRKL